MIENKEKKHETNYKIYSFQLKFRDPSQKKICLQRIPDKTKKKTSFLHSILTTTEQIQATPRPCDNHYTTKPKPQPDLIMSQSFAIQRSTQQRHQRQHFVAKTQQQQRVSLLRSRSMHSYQRLVLQCADEESEASADREGENGPICDRSEHREHEHTWETGKPRSFRSCSPSLESNYIPKALCLHC